jgi:hypothetical protein
MMRGCEATASNLGLFLVWSNAHGEDDRVLDRAQTLFEVRGVHAIHWTPQLFEQNAVRFCRGRLDPPLLKLFEERADGDPLYLISAVDGAPRYEPKTVSNGAAPVNARFVEVRRELRAWTGSDSRVHAAVSAAEVGRDLMLLLGTDPATYLRENASRWNGRITEIHRDLTGARGWDTPAELFHALNQAVRYVVMRNFEGLPGSLHVGSHEDVDILTDDYDEMIAVMNARPNVRCIPRWGGPYWVKISGQDMWFDVRFVGDHYYDPAWAGAILDRRVWNDGGFYSPCAEDYFESLAYHAVVHKPSLSADYRERLATMASALGRAGWEPAALEDPARVKALLDAILQQRGSRYRRPRDVNVFYNFEATGHRWPQLRRKLAGVGRKAVRVGYRVQRSLSGSRGAARAGEPQKPASQTAARLP